MTTRDKWCVRLGTLAAAFSYPGLLFANAVVVSLAQQSMRLWRWLDHQFARRFSYSCSRLIADAWQGGAALGMAAVLLAAVTAPWWSLMLIGLASAEWIIKHRVLIVAFILVT